MDEVCTPITPITPDASATEHMLSATASAVFAEFASGFAVSVEHLSDAQYVGLRDGLTEGDSTRFVGMRLDFGDGVHSAEVSFHSCDSDRLATIRQAKVALEAAEKALLGVGYVDYSERREEGQRVSAG